MNKENDYRKENNRLKNWYKFFLIIGLIGIIDIASRQFKGSEMVSIDSGFILYLVAQLGYIFGDTIGLFLYRIFTLICGFALLWLIIAYYLHLQIKKSEIKER